MYHTCTLYVHVWYITGTLQVYYSILQVCHRYITHILQTYYSYIRCLLQIYYGYITDILQVYYRCIKPLFYLQLTHLLTWSPVPPVVALSFFSRQFPPHPITAQFAVRVLSSYPPVSIIIFDTGGKKGRANPGNYKIHSKLERFNFPSTSRFVHSRSRVNLDSHKRSEEQQIRAELALGPTFRASCLYIVT